MMVKLIVILNVLLFSFNSFATEAPACESNEDIGEDGYYCQKTASMAKNNAIGVTKSNVEGAAKSRAVTAANLHCKKVIGNENGEASVTNIEVSSDFVETDSLYKFVAHVEFDCFDEIQ